MSDRGKVKALRAGRPKREARKEFSPQINADEKWQIAERKALREVSSKQLAVRSKAVVGCLPASCPLSYCLLPLLSTQHSELSPERAMRLAI